MCARTSFEPRDILGRLLKKPLPPGLIAQIRRAIALTDADPTLASEAVRLFLAAAHLGHHRPLDDWDVDAGKVYRFYQDEADPAASVPVPVSDSRADPGVLLTNLPLPLHPARPVAGEEQVRELFQIYHQLILGKVGNAFPITRMTDVLDIFVDAVKETTGADEATLWISRELSDPVLEVDVPSVESRIPEVVLNRNAALDEWSLVVMSDLRPEATLDPPEHWRSVAILPLRLPLKDKGNGLVITLQAWSVSPHFWTRPRLRLLGILGRLGPMLVRHASTLQDLSFIDPVSTAYTRKFFEIRLPQELASARRDKRRIALCYVDMDNLKVINEEHLQEGGDKAILHVVRTLREELRRASDWIARMGGDEFCFILTSDPTLETAEAFAERICLRLANPEFGCRDLRGTPPVPVTIGGAMFPDNGEEYGSLVKAADKAMRKGKVDNKGHATFRSRFGAWDPPGEAE